MAERAFRFGDYEIDSAERLLRRAGVVVPLGSRATAALLALLERPGRLLSKQELLERLWPDAVVEENNLDQCISALRKALEDSPRAPRFLETMARRGYRFIAKTHTAEPLRRGPETTSGTLAEALVLEGRFHSNQLNQTAFEAGLRCADAAVALSPDSAAAWEGLAYHSMMGVDLFESPGTAFGRARDAAQRALALDQACAGAWSVLGQVRHWYDRDLRGAEEAHRRAVALDPDSATAERLYAWNLVLNGRFDEATLRLARAAERDPQALENLVFAPATQWFARRFQSALEGARQGLLLYPGHWLFHILEARALEGLGDLIGATAAAERAVAADPLALEALADLGRLRARVGNRDGALEICGVLEAADRQGRPVSPFFPALILAEVDADRAWPLLEATLDERSWYASWIAVAPSLDPLRRCGRWKDLVVRSREPVH
jgi:DNA-binding winged helix-turn-helix (wHTH) protein/Tfp pilus assembly protein PilF